MAALLAVTLPALWLTMGLVIDVAYLFWLRTVLQATVDMAALAAAQNIDLEALARGERRFLPSSAVADARRWVRENLALNPVTAKHVDTAAVRVDVYNASPERPLRHRYSGRILFDPTVNVRVSVVSDTLVVRAIIPAVSVTVTADASLLEKAPPLPY